MENQMKIAAKEFIFENTIIKDETFPVECQRRSFFDYLCVHHFHCKIVFFSFIKAAFLCTLSGFECAPC